MLCIHDHASFCEQPQCPLLLGATFEDKRRLPAWMTNFEATKFDSTESISRIRQIGLQPNRAILATIIFQTGRDAKKKRYCEA